MDRLPGRKRCHRAAAGEENLGAEGRDPALDSCLQLEEVVGLCRAGFPLGGQRCRLWFQLRPGSYNASSLIDFLRDLKKHLRGQPVILIWDGLPAHKSREMRAYLESQKSWLSVEMLPGYSPDLNPVEDLWGNVKGQELANRCVEGLADAEAALRSGLNAARLPFSFLRHTGLLF